MRMFQDRDKSLNINLDKTNINMTINIGTKAHEDHNLPDQLTDVLL